LKQIQDVEKRITELKKSQMTNRNTLADLGDPETAYSALRSRWNELHGQKIQILDGQCQLFSSLSNGLIRADIKKSLDVASLKQKFKTAFASLNVKEQKIEDLCQCVLTAADPMAQWNGILTDLEKLVLLKTTGTSPLPTTAIIDKCGFIDNEKRRLASGFESARWLDLSVTELE
jgi:hypothetical protein